MIEIKNLCKSFDGKVIFSDYSVHIPDGVCAIMAGSGIGKTTLLRILAGLDKDYKGDISGVGSISYCPQSLSLFPWYSAERNLKIVLKNVTDADTVIKNGLEAFGLSDSAGKKPHELSGGMCQRVAILRAWLFSSDTVILDEPFKGLDNETKLRVIEYLKSIRKSTRNVIFTTHSAREAELFADHIIKF